MKNQRRRILALALSLLMLVSSVPLLTGAALPQREASPIPLQASGHPFLDVESHWGETLGVFAFVYERGLMSGVDTYRFDPGGLASREMAVTTLWRLAGEPEVTATHGFHDVPEGEWYSAAITWAATTGVVTGITPNHFGLGAHVTREQFVTMFYRWAAPLGVMPGHVLNPFPDRGQISDFARRESMPWAISIGLISGRATPTGTILAPQGNIERAEMAAILMRYVQRSELPELFSLHITTLGDDLPFVERTLWIDSLFTMTNPDGEVDFEDRIGRIRGRGNSSWWQPDLHEKRPLRIRFDWDSDDRDTRNREWPMADSEHAARDWVLIANHSDKSLLRNYSAYYLGGLLDSMYWSPFARSLHLYVNGEYMGIYMLADERDVGPNRAQLTANSDPAISEYLIELDWRNYRDGAVEGVDFIRVNTSPTGPRPGSPPSHVGAGVFDRDHLYDFRFPDDDVLTAAHLDYVQTFLTRVGLALRSGNMAEIESLVDIDSLIDFYLVQELYQNVDAGFSSVFMQIRGQGENRRLELGPLWDFDVAAGNADWLSNQTPYRLYVSNRWYWARALHDTPELRARMVERWNDIFKDAAGEMFAHVREKAERYEIAFERNFIRHEIMGRRIWPNPPQVVEIDTFMGQVDYLLDFLERRLNYLDGVFNR